MMDQTGDSIANEVLLVRDTYNGSVLILEGVVVLLIFC